MACNPEFCQSVTLMVDLQEAVTEFASRASEKLKKQGSHTVQVLVFIRTSPFRRKDKPHFRFTVVPLRRPTDDSLIIIQAALMGLTIIYQPGNLCAKAGGDAAGAERRQHLPGRTGAGRRILAA
jgi:DNA polymerase V